MENKIKSTNELKLNIYLLYLIVFFQGFIFYGPVATLYRQSRGITMYQVFLIESVFWILMLVFEIPWGWFADRFGYKKTLVISNIIFFISKIVFYKAFSFQVFLFERILLAVAISGLSGCDMALLYASVDGKESQKVFGRYNALAAGGYLIASLMSTLIIKNSLDRSAYLSIFPYGIAVILTLLLKDVKVNLERKPRLRDSLRTTFSNRQIVLLVISIALIREVFQATSVFLNQLQYIRSGIDLRYFGLLAVAIQIVNLSSAKSHTLSNKLGNNKSIEILIICIMLSCSALIFIDNQILSVILIMLIAGSMSLMTPIISEIQNKSIVTEDRATILSIYAMVGNVVAAIINPFIGKTADVSVGAAFTTCLVIAVCGYGFFLLYKRMKVTTVINSELA